MYIDEGDRRALVINTVNCLHYLKYEGIAHMLSGYYFLHFGSIIWSDRHIIGSSLHDMSPSYG